VSFIDLVKNRCSVRLYTDQSVEQEKLDYIFEAARFAPSACNFQPWLFIVVKDKQSRFRLKTVYDKKWFLEAPAIISVCFDRRISWKRRYEKDFGDIDAAIAMDHLTPAAAELGLGTCWIGAFNAADARKQLKLPEYIEPVAFTPLGYPAERCPEKIRKQRAKLVFQNIYTESTAF
jgi:nitroreductase